MGPILNSWTRDMMDAYLRLHGVDAGELGDIVLDGDFLAAREEANRRLGLDLGETLSLPECRLEWNSHGVDGSTAPTGRVFIFTPAEPCEMPEIGAEVRLRVATGSHRALVLGRDAESLTLARAPHRLERRLHKRIQADGLAIVRIGAGEVTTSIADISEGGVGLEGAFLVETGQHVDVLLRVEGNASLSFECEGLVASCRRTDKNGNPRCRAGVMFKNLPADIRDEIRKMVRQDSNT